MPDNYVLLETIEVTQTTSSVTFDNIPQTGYTDLVLKASARSTRAGLDEDGFTIRLNASTSGYTYKTIIGTGTGVTNLNTTYEQTWAGEVNAGSSTANVFNNLEAYIPNYAGSSAKSYMVDAVQENNGTAGYISMNSIIQSSTSPITSITCGAANGNVLAGSTFSLYGVAKLGTTPAISAKATGGNIVANDGTYWYHAFLTSGSFAPQTNLTCDVLVIAGGGAGGYLYSGGGGAGGVCYQTGRSVTTGSKSVIIGGGGAAPSSTANGGSGSNSVFDTITALGGAGGAAWINGVGTNGFSGGSGSGGSMGSSAGDTTSGGAATQGSSGGATGYGNAGGGGRRGAGELYLAGGGGGAGAAGGTATTTQAGAGGAGLDTWSAWAAATNTGVSGFYAGGGAAGAEGSGVTGQLGGAGGGGRGQLYNTITATSGVPNTGSGGGGIANQSTPGSGGSGIVIIRYPMA